MFRKPTSKGCPFALHVKHSPSLKRHGGGHAAIEQIDRVEQEGIGIVGRSKHPALISPPAIDQSEPGSPVII
jgi:hypothetical protein